MKFLLEFVGCCGSSSSATRRRPADARFLAVEEPPRRTSRKQGRARGSGHEWRPSLSAISEDVLLAKNQPAEGWPRSLRRKVAAVSQADRRRSSDHDVHRRSQISNAMPAFSPAPFMF